MDKQYPMRPGGEEGVEPKLRKKPEPGNVPGQNNPISTKFTTCGSG